jgi:hypothetical protein
MVTMNHSQPKTLKLFCRKAVYFATFFQAQIGRSQAFTPARYVMVEKFPRAVWQRWYDAAMAEVKAGASAGAIQSVLVELNDTIELIAALAVTEELSNPAWAAAFDKFNAVWSRLGAMVKLPKLELRTQGGRKSQPTSRTAHAAKKADHRLKEVPSLIPVQRVTRRPGTFRWQGQPVLASPSSADFLPLGQLQHDMYAYLRVRAEIARNAWGSCSVRIHRGREFKGRESYTLSIAPKEITIVCSTDAGAYYAVQTLRELLAIHGRSLPCCRIEDWPDFARRGIYHDCSRGKVPTLETLKALVERLARWKMNELQLYVENVFFFHRHPDIGADYSPLTAEEILSLQDHCRLHHVRLVGSFASFGHLELVLKLPRYRRLGETYMKSGDNPGSTLCPTDPGSIKLLSELYEEYVPLFEAEDFHICGDETYHLGNFRSRRRARQIGVGNLYLEFLLKIYRLCQKHNKRMNAWADIILDHPHVLPRVPKDIVMLNWGYRPTSPSLSRTGEIARTGLPMMVCPGTNGWGSHGSRMGDAMGNVILFAAQGRKHGAIGLLDTDWGDAGHRNFLGISLHGFAHAAAHAWNGRGVDDRRFTETFCFHVFGQRDARLAQALRTLGHTYLTIGVYHKSEGALYSFYRDSVLPATPCRSPIDRSNPAGWPKVVAALSDPRIWPDPKEQDDPFEAMALREMAVAARMDVLSCRRAIIRKNLQDGSPVDRTELAGLADDLHRTANDFKRLWLARNKLSRLQDNLALFRKAEMECRKLVSNG